MDVSIFLVHGVLEPRSVKDWESRGRAIAFLLGKMPLESFIPEVHELYLQMPNKLRQSTIKFKVHNYFHYKEIWC